QLWRRRSAWHNRGRKNISHGRRAFTAATNRDCDDQSNPRSRPHARAAQHLLRTSKSLDRTRARQAAGDDGHLQSPRKKSRDCLMDDDPQQIAKRLERENRSLAHQREIELDRSLEGFRVGSVPYLNAVPLARGIEDQIILATPARLAEMLQRDELDAALVSITEVLFTDRYDV